MRACEYILGQPGDLGAQHDQGPEQGQAWHAEGTGSPSCARGGEGRGEGKEGTGRAVRLCHSQGRAASRGQPLRLSGPHSLTSADFMPDPIL